MLCFYFCPPPSLPRISCIISSFLHVELQTQILYFFSQPPLNPHLATKNNDYQKRNQGHMRDDDDCLTDSKTLKNPNTAG